MDLIFVATFLPSTLLTLKQPVIEFAILKHTHLLIELNNLPHPITFNF